MKGKFYTVDYIPNKLVYILNVNDKIEFLAFINKKGVKHKVNKATSKKDFKLLKDFVPTDCIMKMINEA